MCGRGAAISSTDRGNSHSDRTGYSGANRTTGSYTTASGTTDYTGNVRCDTAAADASRWCRHKRRFSHRFTFRTVHSCVANLTAMGHSGRGNNFAVYAMIVDVAGICGWCCNT